MRFGSPVMRTVFCLEVWPATTSAFEPVSPEKY